MTKEKCLKDAHNDASMGYIQALSDTILAEDTKIKGFKPIQLTRSMIKLLIYYRVHEVNSWAHFYN